MTRIHIICEGQTEEAFVSRLLVPSFAQKGIYLFPSLIGQPGHKGGNVNIDRIYKDVRNHLLSDRDSFCTTFFDYYGLAENFPGKRESYEQFEIADKARCIHKSLMEWLKQKIDINVLRRFIPYVQIYEFEALLFSNPTALAFGLRKSELMDDFQAIRNDFPSPEHINNSVATAPSKRLELLVNGYQKTLSGELAAISVGLDAMRKECALFGKWLSQLEDLKHDSPNSSVVRPVPA